MAIESVAGRPPSHRLRRIEWRAIAIGLPVLIIGAIVWAVFRGVSGVVIVGFGVVGCLFLLIGGWPILAAGLLREKEEITARHEAVAELPRNEERE